METKGGNKSFTALSQSDSGLKLANSDSLARKNEQQQLEIETQSKKIVELEDIVDNLEDVIIKCKSLPSFNARFMPIVKSYYKQKPEGWRRKGER